jgi:hypothetical protein
MRQPDATVPKAPRHQKPGGILFIHVLRKEVRFRHIRFEQDKSGSPGGKSVGVRAHPKNSFSPFPSSLKSFLVCRNAGTTENFHFRQFGFSHLRLLYEWCIRPRKLRAYFFLHQNA